MDMIEQGSLPEQHEDQLQLGFRMIQNAFTNKVNGLTQELRALQITHEDQKTQAATTQRKNAALEMELVESHQRAQQLAEENKELFKTVQQLRKQISRLEDLKKKVMSSIQDEATTATETADQTSLYMNDEYLRGAMPLTYQSYGEPQLGRAPGALERPQATYANAPSRGEPDKATSPPPSQAQAAIDGKQFFRMARNNLSYEAFNDFLANIKRLNNSAQTREETLANARRIFGTELQNLYLEFEQLLNRHSV